MTVILPTVRVRNPNLPGSYMVVNQCDLKEHHELWPDQEPGYVPAARAATAVAVAEDLASIFGREVVVSMRVFGKLMAKKLGYTPDQWAELSPDQRADLIETEEPKVDASIADGPQPDQTPVQEEPVKPKWKGGK